MKFKDYLKDRLLYIVFYIISTTLVIVVMMLDLIIKGEKLKVSNIAYAYILSTVFLVLLIAIDYMKKRKFYSAINDGLDSYENLEYIFNIPNNISREHNMLKELLIKDYKVYQNTLEKYKKSYKTHTDFNNRWIHQMKTPISVIKLILENEKDKNIDEATKKSYESIEEEMEKLSNGLEMALYTLRVNDFEQDFKVEEINILDVVRNIINENKNAFIVNSIYPKIISNEDIVVKTDKKWIKFIVGQIISNSIKYSKVKKSKDKSIVINIHKEDDKVILSIKDNGVGIPSQDLERVFNPFFTGENGRVYSESTGMGLYLSKDICNRLGHGIDIESTEGIGTTVNIVFHHGKSIYNL